MPNFENNSPFPGAFSVYNQSQDDYPHQKKLNANVGYRNIIGNKNSHITGVLTFVIGLMVSFGSNYPAVTLAANNLNTIPPITVTTSEQWLEQFINIDELKSEIEIKMPIKIDRFRVSIEENQIDDVGYNKPVNLSFQITGIASIRKLENLLENSIIKLPTPNGSQTITFSEIIINKGENETVDIRGKIKVIEKQLLPANY